MLDISPLLLGITAVVFIALIALLNSMLYKPLFAFMENRDLDIKNDLEQVGKTDDEIKAMHVEAEEIMSKARLQAAAEREKVIAESKKAAEAKLETKRAELVEAYAAFETELSEQREALRAALAEKTPVFKDAVTAKIGQI